jgi:hypothetical protein
MKARPRAHEYNSNFVNCIIIVIIYCDVNRCDRLKYLIDSSKSSSKVSDHLVRFQNQSKITSLHILVPEFEVSHKQTDRQTDGQTDGRT